MKINGNDFSHHQGKVDWDAVKAAGKTQFAILHAGYGRYDSQVDEQWARNYSECKRLGIPVGAYWYSYATTVEQARQEMQCFLRALKGKQLEYPVYFDQEYKPGIKALTTAQRTAIVKAALEVLEGAGYYAGLYCSRDWLNNWLDAARLSAYDVWIADYTSAEPSPAELPYGIRQIDSRNSFGVPGFGGSLDCDVAYRDYPGIIKKAGLNGWPKQGGGEAAAEKPADAPAQPKAMTLTLNDVDAAAQVAKKAAELGLNPVVTIATDPASSGDYATLRNMTTAAGGKVG